MHRLMLTTAVVLALVAASCGDDDGGDGAGEAEAAAAADASTTTTHDHNAMVAAERDEEPVSVDSDDRCDLGLNTAEFNRDATLVERLNEHSHAMQAGEVDFTVREWAEVFVDPSLGLSVDEVTETIEGDPDFRSIILGGVIADTLEADSWVPMTDPAQCEALAEELQTARDVAARYPTAADAIAAGYTGGSVYVPGKGAHFSNLEYIDGTFDPEHPEMLMYDGLDPSSELMGMSYFVHSPDGVADDEGFTGPSDRWHSHDTNCVDDNGVAIAPTECEAGRGTLQTDLNLWMVHAWVVPGCESPWGVFSGTNPRLPSLPPGDNSIDSGCNSGKTVDDPVEMDDAGDGPRVE